MEAVRADPAVIGGRAGSKARRYLGVDNSVCIVGKVE